MDASEQIKRMQEFLESYQHAELLEKIRKGMNFHVIDFADLSEFDPDIAEELLENPHDIIKATEIAIEQFDLPEKVKRFNVRFKNLPESQKMLIRNIRSKHIGKLITIIGVVRQKSDVRPQVTQANFECPSCGNVIQVPQLDTKFLEPSRCGCGRKGKFRLLSKELIDAQGIVLEESSEDLEGGEQPKRMNIFLKEDLVSPITEKKTNPGSKILIVGVTKEIPIILKTGSQSIRYDLIVEANYVEPIEEDFSDISITEEEKEKIIELSNDIKIHKKLINSIAPSIYGHDRVKEAILLQLVGGVRKKRKDGIITRGDMHVLLIGDPGAGKSQLLKRTAIIAPKARFVSGKGASGAGLTAAVVKDEFLKGWSLEAGALVLANKGICCIDELDKMSVDDRSAMHEALEGQTITISKANIQATLRAETTVLAAANPKFGRFDPYDILAKQIDLPPALISRFDLIFPIKDLPDSDKDEKMARHILRLHQTIEEEEPDIDTPFLKKYICYSRQKVFPNLTDSAIEEIKRYYVEMRNSASTEEKGIKTIPITARQLEALVRMSEANAKIRLSDKVTKKDARRAIDLLQYCLSQVGLDPETGKIDIDRISSGITTTQRSKIISVKEIISELESKLGKTIPIEDIIKEAANKGIAEDDVEETIEKLKRSGDLFEPRRGFVSRI
ncbi:minichromosome maintenance protein MCM [Candidatus Woesearchaeota archaeon]|nr:minichromosome maintenance protein MCM [Candidatus Woesearchaeota archaeon]